MLLKILILEMKTSKLELKTIKLELKTLKLVHLTQFPLTVQQVIL